MTRTLYKLVDKLNGMIYVGSTRHIEKRLISHRNPAKGRMTPIVARIREIGFENFTVEILDRGTEIYILKLERDTILSLNCTMPHGYNVQGYGAIKRKIFANGFEYPDIVEASKVLQCSVKSIKGRIYRNKDGFRWL